LSITGFEGLSREARLKREVGWFDSFAMGYGDVGADIFIALGIVALYAGGAAPLAFLIAALIYLSIGLAYAELAPTYPYAGGVQVYALRASNALLSFVAGWAIMLDYILDLSLFATAASGYLKYLSTWVRALSIQISPGLKISSLGLIASLLIAFLIVINYVGIKYSADLISGLVIIGLIVQVSILAMGFLTKFNANLFLSQLMQLGNPKCLADVEYFDFLDMGLNNFLYGLTLAMASFIGIESIAQAAEETRKPYKWIPKAVKLCVSAVILFTLLFSVLSIGVLDWRVLGSSYENPVAVLVSRFPVFGEQFSTLVALTAFLLCLASANTGLIGVSRLTASMGRFHLIPRWFYQIHPRFRTPVRTIIIFGIIGLLLALPGDIPLLASLYNFGALLSYLLLMISLLLLRSREREVYRPWKMPFSIKLRDKGEYALEIPVLGLLGLVGTTAVWILVILLHPAGRLFGFIWMAAGIALYAAFRKLSKKPILGREERGMVLPAGYKMRVAVLVRPYDDPAMIKRSIERALDKRFCIKLLSIVDVPEHAACGREEAEIEAARRETEEALASLAKELRSMGYDAEYEVRAGDLEEILEEEAERSEVDFLAYIVRGFGKAYFEKGFDEKVHSLMLRYPGKIMLLKRVTE
jgi:APA family basic amino acid/polyamine antiporter